jgi:hypothetical protein
MVNPTPPELPVRSPPETAGDHANTHQRVAFPLFCDNRRKLRPGLSESGPEPFSIDHLPRQERGALPLELPAHTGWLMPQADPGGTYRPPSLERRRRLQRYSCGLDVGLEADSLGVPLAANGWSVAFPTEGDNGSRHSLRSPDRPSLVVLARARNTSRASVALAASAQRGVLTLSRK